MRLTHPVLTPEGYARKAQQLRHDREALIDQLGETEDRIDQRKLRARIAAIGRSELYHQGRATPGQDDGQGRLSLSDLILTT